MSRFTEVLLVSPLADGRTWVTRREFGYDIGEEGSGNTIDVPIGFMTDFASVPRPLWWFLPTWGKYGNAAVIHDYCYWEQSHSRGESDLIFREGMRVLKVPPHIINFMYWAVKWFGKSAWVKNSQMKAEGIKRITPVTPLKEVKAEGVRRITPMLLKRRKAKGLVRVSQELMPIKSTDTPSILRSRM